MPPKITPRKCVWMNEPDGPGKTKPVPVVIVHDFRAVASDLILVARGSSKAHAGLPRVVPDPVAPGDQAAQRWMGPLQEDTFFHVRNIDFRRASDVRDARGKFCTDELWDAIVVHSQGHIARFAAMGWQATATSNFAPPIPQNAPPIPPTAPPIIAAPGPSSTVSVPPPVAASSADDDDP